MITLNFLGSPSPLPLEVRWLKISAVRDLGGASSAALGEALNTFAWEMGGNDDIHATAGYRRELVRRLGPKVIEEARACQS